MKYIVALIFIGIAVAGIGLFLFTALGPSILGMEKIGLSLLGAIIAITGIAVSIRILNGGQF
jgi:hypothetical protein